MLASPAPDLDASTIFFKAQAAWSQRAVPPYESFVIPCEQTPYADRCDAHTPVQFIVRISDAKYLAQTLDASGHPTSVLARGADLVGPAGAPFGFFRRAPQPGTALAVTTSAPASDPVSTIASVSAVDRAYDVTLDGTTQIDAASCYRLRLRPLRDPQNYRLREVDVEKHTFEIAGLTYVQPYNDTTAIVHYRFAPAGPQRVWTLVHIDAEAPRERVDQDLTQIAFPPSEPDADFIP